MYVKYASFIMTIDEDIMTFTKIKISKTEKFIILSLIEPFLIDRLSPLKFIMLITNKRCLLYLYNIDMCFLLFTSVYCASNSSV